MDRITYYLKYGYLGELADFFDIQHSSYDYIIDEYIPELFTDFFIIKKPNNDLVCISPTIQIINFYDFHPSQLDMMRINFSSFTPNFNNIHDVSILRNQIKIIIEQIYQSIKPEQLIKNYSYLLFNKYIKEVKTEFCIECHKMMKKIGNSNYRVENIDIAREVMNIIYSNFNYVSNSANFKITIINKINELLSSINFNDDIYVINKFRSSCIRVTYIIFRTDSSLKSDYSKILMSPLM